MELICDICGFYAEVSEAEAELWGILIMPGHVYGIPEDCRDICPKCAPRILTAFDLGLPIYLSHGDH